MGQCVSRKGAHALARARSSPLPLRRKTLPSRSMQQQRPQQKPRPERRIVRSTSAIFPAKPMPATIPKKPRPVSFVAAGIGGTVMEIKNNIEAANTTGTTASSGAPGGVVKHGVALRGVATSFGFKPRQRPTSAIPIYHDNRNPNETPTSFDVDTNGNASTKASSTRISSAPETNMNRFSNSTRQNSASRIIRSANPKPAEIIAGYNNVEFRNNNSAGRAGSRLRVQPRSVSCADQNRNKPTATVVGRYKLQTTNFPKPQVPTTVRMDSKNIKHATNTNRKYHQDRGESSTDSGMGSEPTTTDIEILDTSPKTPRSRHLDLFMTKGGKKFDVRDLSDDGTVIESSLITLPKLPSVFQTSTAETSPTSQQTSPLAPYQPPPRSFSLVRERTLEYQRNLLQQQPTTPLVTPLRSSSRTMSTSIDSTEEKVTRDRTHAEKDTVPLHSSQCGGESMAVIHSKKMTSSIKSSPGTFQNLSSSTILTTSATLKSHSVTLTMDDSKFAAVAAASSNLLEDETSPVDSLVSSCTDSEELALGKPKEDNEKNSKDIDEKASPETPTNVSLSLSDSKDYFDDEIADQPTLHVFENEIPISETTITLVDNTHNSPQMAKKKACEDKQVSASPLTHRKLLDRLPQLRRSGSLNTLSPCESIASDDLMMDFELSHGSGLESSNDRLDSKNTSGMPSLDEPELLAGGDSANGDILRELHEELAALINNSGEDASSRSGRFSTSSPRGLTPVAGGAVKNGVANGSDVMVDGASSPLLQQTHASRSRLTTTSSTSTPISAHHPSHLSHSPLRLTRRYAQTSTSSSPIPARLASIGVTGGGGGGDRGGYDSDDSLCIDRAMHGSMMQDIVGMKTMLLKLKRVLQEPDNTLTKSETLNPFDSPLKVANGNCHCGSDKVESVVGIRGTSDRFELADLRRQVVFLQEQLEERERIVQHLRQQVADHTLSNSAPTSICTTTSSSNGSAMEMCNAATQTERVRPMSAGPSLLQNFPTVIPGTSAETRATNGPLVSVNEPETPIVAVQKRKILRRPPSLVEFRPNHKFKL